jgi:hypothetical protein
MMSNRRSKEDVLRFQERRKREDDAPRLRDEIPELQSLRLVLDEFRHGGAPRLVHHTRHVVVERAPALFVVPCCDSDCDGEHDLTREVLRMLRTSAKQFEGELECYGERNKSTCHHELRYRAHARYIDEDV